jgi:hypothetical protein
LGIRGNYEELYQWLDENDAVECGESVATFTSKKSKENIQKELKGLLNKEARIYLIRKDPDGRFRGGFILGNRKAKAPWIGYAIISEKVEEEVI